MKRKAANKAKSSSIHSGGVLETSAINISSANNSSSMSSGNLNHSSALQVQPSSGSNIASSLFPTMHSDYYFQDSELSSQSIAEYRNSSNFSSSEPVNPNITSTNTYEGNLIYSNSHANESHMA